MEFITIGLATAFSPQTLLYCFIGVFLGTFIGVLPGIGALAAMSFLLPLTFHVDATAAIVMLAGVYYGAEYGGSTASILLNLPGTPGNAVTCLDGYPMAQKGKAGLALFTTTIASFVGGTIGIVILMFLTPVVVAFSLSFGSAEYFAAMLLGLMAAATISRGSSVNGLAMVLLGVLLATIGPDLTTGIYRFNLGYRELYDGVNVVVLAMGLFGVGEVIAAGSIGGYQRFTGKVTFRSMLPSKLERRLAFPAMLRGTAVGSVFGPLPGTGPTISAFVSYAIEKRISRHPEKFGDGAIEGVASPEASNNAAVQTAFIPTLSLGIPGTASMAIILTALMINGLPTGPRLMSEYPDVFWGLVATFWIGNIMLLVLNIPLIGMWVRILKIPGGWLYPGVIVLTCIGVYSINRSIFDVWMLLVIGLAGYGMRLARLEPAPLLMGFVLGPLMEENLRRALLLTQGDFLGLVTRPISGTLLALSFLILIFVVAKSVRKRRTA